MKNILKPFGFQYASGQMFSESVSKFILHYPTMFNLFLEIELRIRGGDSSK